jgi:hypothetical protein
MYVGRRDVVSTEVVTEAGSREQMVADRITRERAYAGRQFTDGDFVAILGDEVVAVGRSYDAVAAALTEREPRHDRGVICVVSDAGPDVIRSLAHR